MAGSRVLAHVVDQYPTPRSGHSQRLRHLVQRIGPPGMARNIPSNAGPVAMDLGLEFRRCSTKWHRDCASSRAIPWFFGNMDHTHRLESIAMGHPRAMDYGGHHQPRNMVLKFVRYLDVVWRADPQSTKPDQRPSAFVSFHPLDPTRQDHSAARRWRSRPACLCPGRPGAGGRSRSAIAAGARAFRRQPSW